MKRKGDGEPGKKEEERKGEGGKRVTGGGGKKCPRDQTLAVPLATVASCFI